MAQFNSLTDRVRQMLGGIVQQAPKTLSGIGNAALDAVNPNIRPAMKSAQILKQNVQAIPRLMPQFQQNARANPIPMKAFEGLVEGTTVGLKDINYRPSQNLPEKLAYGTGYTLGMLNPVSPFNLAAKGIKATGALSGAQKLLGGTAGKLIAQGGAKKLLGTGVANLSQGLPYTTAYSAIRTAGGQGKISDVPTDLGFDLALGSIPVIGGLAVGIKGNKKVISKTVDQVAEGLSSEVEKIAIKLLKEGNDTTTVMKKLMSVPNIDQKAIMNTVGQADKIIRNPIMYLLDKASQTKDVGLLKYIENVASKTNNTELQSALREVKKGLVTQAEEAVDPLLSEAKKYKSAEEFVAAARTSNMGMTREQAKATIYKDIKPGDGEEGVIKVLTDIWNQANKGSDLKQAIDIESSIRDNVSKIQQDFLDGKITMDQRKALADKEFARSITNKANTAPVGKVANAKIQSIKKDLDWYDNWFGLNDWKASKSRIKEMTQARDVLKEELVRLEGATTGGAKVANTSQPKTGGTIKVVDQSRTQQPISSSVSGNVGTEAKASVGQTSQPILETAPLNKSIPQRGFAESVQTNKKTPAEIKPELEKIRYEPISNAETMAQADKIIQTDELKALDFAKNNADTTANSVSLKLIEKYLDQGRFSEANDLISAVAPRFTKAGQEIQILSTYGRLTPTGAIKYAQTLINQANKANPRLNLKLTEANTKIITEYANRVQSLPVGSRERIVATAQLMQKITDQVPPSIGQKIATIQTMMQLLNPKTAVRNIIGNTLFTGAENISDVLATGLDRVTGFITGRRSKVLPSITAQGRGFIKGGREGFQDAMLGIDTSGGVSSQFEIKGKTFTDPILGSLEKALNIELRVPDRAAYTAAFEGSLNNQMRAAGITKATPEMIEIAHADGLYRTFQDNSRLAQIFSGIKKTLNKIGTPDGRFGLGDFVLKYPKTPANILSRGLDYSPAGFVKGIYEGIRPFMTGQPFNQKQFVENLSRAMVGTGLISAGYILAKNGIISGKNDKDYDISSVKRTTGQGAFKLNASALSRFFQSGGQKQDDQNGDVLVSYDWAQPTSIQVAMGANSALGGNAEDMASIASDNLQAGVDTLTGQSMVKNLMDYAGGIKDKGFVGATQDMALNSATGFIPSVVRQTANVFDPLQRSTYAGTPAGVAINKAKATIPFVRNTLEPKLDVFGKEMPNYEGSGLQRLFDIFVNPAFVTKIQENPAAKEVIDIYQRSGLTTQAPRVADSKIKINGQDVKVSPQQYTQYQRYMGTKTDETFNALMNDPLFRKSSDEDKAKLLQGILTDINSAAKIELFGNNPKSIPQDVKTIMKTTNNATDRMLTLTKEGNLKMAMGDIEYPKLTGNTELDKKLITAYRGKITQKANEITAMYEAGEITAAQAETELNKLIELKSKVSTKKAKKAPKITVRKLSAPKVAKSARIKIKIPKLKKPKTLKLKKYTVKLSK